MKKPKARAAPVGASQQLADMRAAWVDLVTRVKKVEVRHAALMSILAADLPDLVRRIDAEVQARAAAELSSTAEGRENLRTTSLASLKSTPKGSA